MFDELPLAANAAMMAAAALVVWLAGTRLVRYADVIADKTGIGRDLIGILLLGGVTSLPELAVAVTASLAGAPALSVGNLLGAAAINVVILALADAIYGKRALTSTPASAGVLLQGMLGILLLALVLAPVLAGDRLVFGIGGWSWLILAAYLMSVRIIARAQGSRAWVPTAHRDQSHESRRTSTELGRESLNRLIAKTALVGGVILIAGFVLAKTGDALADQTGLGASFVGAVFLAISTTLPEMSTVIAAVRLRRYEMAIADVFGTNLFNLTIIVLVDALYPGAPVLTEIGAFAAFGALLAIVLTALFVVGMVERRDRTILRMGYDSIAALACYAGGVVVLYQLR